MTRLATRWMSLSSSTRRTSGRGTSAGSGREGGANCSVCSENFLSQSCRGAADQKRCLNAAGDLQKQVRQRAQTRVRSVTRQEHHGASMASKDARQLKHSTSYRALASIGAAPRAAHRSTPHGAVAEARSALSGLEARPQPHPDALLLPAPADADHEALREGLVAREAADVDLFAVPDYELGRELRHAGGAALAVDEVAELG